MVYRPNALFILIASQIANIYVTKKILTYAWNFNVFDIIIILRLQTKENTHENDTVRFHEFILTRSPILRGFHHAIILSYTFRYQ